VFFIKYIIYLYDIYSYISEVIIAVRRAGTTLSLRSSAKAGAGAKRRNPT
jgi:hypothetical protein